MRLQITLAAATILCSSLALAQAQPAVDASAAEALMKQSGCTKCHSVSAAKVGPPFKETAAKYKGKTDAEEKLYTHLTTSPKIKMGGNEAVHDSLKTKDAADVRNVVRYIMSR